MPNKVLLINVDSTIPNLALKKIELYHKNMGYVVEEYDREYLDTLLYEEKEYDSIWVSCIFDWNKDTALSCKKYHKNVYIGGSGVDYKTILPIEIDNMKPKINYGFTTRGCIRNCPFCIVPQKEGKIHAVGDIYDIWDNKSKALVIMDNNILAMPEHFFKISAQLKKEKLKVDFNQGLDARLLNDEIAKELKSLRHMYEIRFAFDDIKLKPQVERAMELVYKYNLRTRWYLYTDGDWETLLERVKYLRYHKQLAFVMRDRKVIDDKLLKCIAAYCNFPIFYRKYTFDEFLNIEHSRVKSIRKNIIDDGRYKLNNISGDNN